MFPKIVNFITNRSSLLRSLSSVGIVMVLLLSSCGGVSSNIAAGKSVLQSGGITANGSNSGIPATESNQSTSLATSVPQTTGTPSSTPSQPATTSSSGVVGSQSIRSLVSTSKIKTVFVIVMENHNWSDIISNPSAPYINSTLLPQASYATQYFNPTANHPSEPNYLWLEAGSSLGISNDNPPAANHQSTTDHLVTYFDKAGITWKAYAESITGKVCPLKGTGLYSPKHTPMVFFDNVTGSNDPKSAYCISHIRPYTELQTDLQNNTIAQYNFITPNLCDDMHNTDGCPTTDAIKNGDTWLSQQVPMIMASTAYKQGGAIFITWDESENGDHPIGMIVLSPLAKGGGYSNSIHYTHSSTLRTIEEIFNITPLLGDAANAKDLSDLFKQFP